MRRSLGRSLGAWLLVLGGLASGAAAAGADASVVAADRREPCTLHDPLRRPFFGDTHVHTALSFDAWGQGTLAGPREAYRFARGETIGIQPYDAAGRPQDHVQLRRPLDFAVVTDHSDLLGETHICQDASLSGYDSLICRVVRRFPLLGYGLVNGHTYSSRHPRRYSFCGEDGALCLEAARGPWREIQDAADAFYDRSSECRFTTFVGYEWTGMPGGANIHRNVIFRNEVVQDRPTTYIETPTAEGLWRALEEECLDAGTGCEAIAIPHNSNLSAGLMWPILRADGTPITAKDAKTRMRLERLVEVTQHKGDSECRAGAEDELCDYETLRMRLLSDMAMPWRRPELPPRVYAREALTEGLVQARRLGVNPFAFGLIGSTDTHFATPGMVDEDRHRGHAAGTVNARFGPPPLPDVPFFNPGGLAVLWAEENSRDALFDAMMRREAYGTSGPRIVARFFAGWDYPEDLCDRPDRVARAYARGVPMGGVLSRAPRSDAAPRFLVSALRDPGGGGTPVTPLQRIQIVKGWVEEGQGRERVFEVAGSAESRADVDLATCEPRGAGYDQLCAVFTDPDYDPESPAYYYARVLENPSCRWTQYLCNRTGAGCDEDLPRTIQERAWTSPIWIP